MMRTDSGTVMEVANVTSRPGADDELAVAYADAIAAVMKHPGARGASVLRQRENPRDFTLLIEWDSVEAHHDFGASGLLLDFRSALDGLVESGSVAHYDTIVVM